MHLVLILWLVASCAYLMSNSRCAPGVVSADCFAAPLVLVSRLFRPRLRRSRCVPSVALRLCLVWISVCCLCVAADRSQFSSCELCVRVLDYRKQAASSRLYMRGATATFIRPFSTSAGADAGAPAVDAGVAASVADAMAARLAETGAELVKIGVQLGELDAEIKELKARLRAAESKPESARDAEEIRSVGVRLHDASQKEMFFLQQKASLEKDVQPSDIVRAISEADCKYCTYPLLSVSVHFCCQCASIYVLLFFSLELVHVDRRHVQHSLECTAESRCWRSQEKRV